MVTPTVLLGALLVAGPSLWRAGQGQLGVDTALVHFLLAVAFVAAGRALLRGIVGAYARVGADGAPAPARAGGPGGSTGPGGPASPLRRRRTDVEPGSTPGIP